MSSDMQLIQQIQLHAAERPGAVAIRQVDVPGGCDRQLTWNELQQRIAATSQSLRQHLPVGAVVMLCMSNRPEFWVAYFACLSASLTVFPIATDMVQAEFETAAARGGVAAVVLEQPGRLRPEGMFPRQVDVPSLGGQLAVLAAMNPPATQPGAGLMLASSGTTGHPKTVWRSGRALDAVASNMVQAIGFSPADRVITGVPLCHSYGGEHGVLAPAWGGSTVHVCSGIDLAILSRELRGGATILPGVPFLFDIMAQTAGDIGSLAHLHHVFSAGAPLPAQVRDAFTRRFGKPIGQIYGATEFGTVTFNDPAQEGFDPGSVGPGLRGVSILILDADSPDVARPLPVGIEGQIAVRAPSMLSHVVGQDDDPFHDGYVLSGDLGKLDSRGALTVTGRLRLLIDVGGRKVNPIEVEQTLAAHPAVADCVIVRVVVSQTVNRLKAIVTLRDPSSPFSPELLREFARQRLSAYKIPRLVEVRSALPRTPLGKVLRHLLETEQ